MPKIYTKVIMNKRKSINKVNAYNEKKILESIQDAHENFGTCHEFFYS